MNITGGIYNRQKITAPDENITRPTLSKVRMSVFNTLNSIVNLQGASFLDMFSGSGIMGIEAISRGAAKLVAIEKNNKAANIIKSNFYRYEKLHDLTLITGDSLKICPKMKNKFDIIYIDPPYFSGIYEKSLEAVRDITCGIVVVEHVTPINLPPKFEVLKQKKYGDKFITFLRYNNEYEKEGIIN